MTGHTRPTSSFIEFAGVSMGVVISFITMGVIQESITKKAYGSHKLKNNLVFFPLAIQTLFCLVISYCVLKSRRHRESNLILDKNLMYVSHD